MNMDTEWRKWYRPLWASHWPLAWFRNEIRCNTAGFYRNKISYFRCFAFWAFLPPVYFFKKILKLVFFRSCALGGYTLIPPFLPFYNFALGIDLISGNSQVYYVWGLLRRQVPKTISKENGTSTCEQWEFLWGNWASQGTMWKSSFNLGVKC